MLMSSASDQIPLKCTKGPSTFKLVSSHIPIEYEIHRLSPTNGFLQILHPILDTRQLLRIEEVLSSFHSEIGNAEVFERLLYNFREVDRSPGYVVDLCIITRRSSRDSEYLIYDALGTLMRENKNMLFDFHIIRRRGRAFNQITPEGYTKHQLRSHTYVW